MVFKIQRSDLNKKKRDYYGKIFMISGKCNIEYFNDKKLYAPAGAIRFDFSNKYRDRAKMRNVCPFSLPCALTLALSLYPFLRFLGTFFSYSISAHITSQCVEKK